MERIPYDEKTKSTYRSSIRVQMFMAIGTIGGHIFSNVVLIFAFTYFQFAVEPEHIFILVIYNILCSLLTIRAISYFVAYHKFKTDQELIKDTGIIGSKLFNGYFTKIDGVTYKSLKGLNQPTDYLSTTNGIFRGDRVEFVHMHGFMLCIKKVDCNEYSYSDRNI